VIVFGNISRLRGFISAAQHHEQHRLAPDVAVRGTQSDYSDNIDGGV